MKTLLVFVLVAIGVTTVIAQDRGPQSGNDLLRKCENVLSSSTETVDSAFCLGHISGFFEGLSLKVSEQSTNLTCYPESPVTAAQLLRIVVKYMQDHPELLHHPYKFLVADALSEAFPCPQL